MESDIPIEVHIPVPVPVPVPDDDLIAEVERLRTELEAAIKERDEARRLWCMAVEEIERRMTNETRYEVAESKGWDCFKEKP